MKIPRLSLFVIPVLAASLLLMIARGAAHGDATPAGSNDVWGTEPLGLAIPTGPPGPPQVHRPLPALFEESVSGGEPFLRTAQDLESCLLVVGEGAPGQVRNSTAHRASLLLQEYFQKITGISVSLTSENKVRCVQKADGSLEFVGPDGQPKSHVIWLGGSQVARDNRVTADDLVPGGYRIATIAEGMVVIGNDAGDAGTFYAAISLLERRLGVRWLWPGDLGTVLPSKEEFSLPKFNEKDEPALRSRNIRSLAFVPGRSDKGLVWLGEDEETFKGKYRDVSQWPRVQRLGGDLQIRGGHAFQGWYERFGESHPDWFALQPDHTRIQIGGRERLCVSNLSLVDEVAKDRLKYLAEKPPGTIVPLAPNDGGATNFFCMCVECRKLDPLDGPPVEMLFGKGPKRAERFTVKYVSLTDRYVTFFNRVAKKVLAEKPDARFTTYAYHLYRDAPLGAPLDPAFTVGFVGLTYFSEADRRKDLERWDKWAARSSNLYLRPNALLGGRDFPCNYTKELAEDLGHCYQTGLVGTDFDAITHDWATRGLNYYVLARLLWNPGLSAEVIVEDYCRTGFGSAAEPVGRYFAELAEATRATALTMGPPKQSEDVREEEVGVKIVPVRERMQRALLAGYTKERLERMAALLALARESAKGDEIVLRRVEFLAAGLEYARLQIATYSVEYAGGDLKQPMQELLDFLRRTSTSQPLAINAAYLLFDQGARFRILK